MIFQVDRLLTPTVVLGIAMLAVTGFNIGSNGAAGGANFVAAYREEAFLQQCSVLVRHELLNRSLILRWADDLIDNWPTNLSAPARLALSRFQQEHFYGGSLRLTQEVNVDACFGLIFQIRNSVVAIKESHKFVADSDQTVLEELWPPLPGFHQCMMGSTFQTVAFGRIIRTLDTTNVREPELIRQLQRLVCGLRIAGIPPVILIRAIRKAHSWAWCSLKPLMLYATNTDMDFIKSWAL